MENLPGTQNCAICFHERPKPSLWVCAQCTFCNAGDHVSCHVCSALKVELWECSRCTFGNPMSSLVCGACDSPKDVSPNSWSCSSCTFSNIRLDTKCLMCSTARDGNAAIDLCNDSHVEESFLIGHARKHSQAFLSSPDIEFVNHGRDANYHVPLYQSNYELPPEFWPARADGNPFEQPLQFRRGPIEPVIRLKNGEIPKEELDEIVNMFNGMNNDLKGMDAPQGMNATLYPHQRVGLEFMVKCETAFMKGGIVSDEMGLGKTIQVIALMLSNQCPLVPKRATLIVVPVAILFQWKEEIEQFSELRVCIYHGPNRRSFSLLLNDFDVVITSYDIVSNEMPINEEKKKRPAGPLHKTTFHRIVLDEGHLIRNRSTKRSISCVALKASVRWVLTGTPIQNSLDDLFPLIAFLRIPPFDKYSKWRAAFGNKNMNITKKKMDDLQLFLSKFVIRRTHSETKSDLPKLHIHVVEREFKTWEKDLYDLVEKRAQDDYQKLVSKGIVLKSYAHVLTMLLRLRQLCDSVDLVHQNEKGGAAILKAIFKANREGRVDKASLVEKLSPNALRRLKDDENKNFESSECPICMDVCDNVCISSCCGQPFCTDCLDESLHNAEGSCPLCRNDKCDPINVYCLRKELGLMEGAAENIAGPDKPNEGEYATKVDLLLEILDQISKEDPGAKTVVRVYSGRLN